MEKKAFIGAALGAAGAAIGQNVIGMPIARSKGFKKSLAKAALMGMMKKKSPRSIKSVASDALHGLVAPEVNTAKNLAYIHGGKARKDLHNKIRKTPEYRKARAEQKASGGSLKLPMSAKRDIAKARMVAMGDDKAIKRTGAHKDPLVQKALDVRKSSGAGSINKKEMHKVSKLPKGNRLPASNKAAIAANIAVSPIPIIGGATAAVNSAKLLAGTKVVQSTKAMKTISKKVAIDPVKNSYKKGTSGGHFSTGKNRAKAILANPFTAEADKNAYHVGKEVRKNKSR